MCDWTAQTHSREVEYESRQERRKKELIIDILLEQTPLTADLPVAMWLKVQTLGHRDE